MPLRRVVQGGYCVGCGTCAALPGAGLSMVRLRDGRHRPVAHAAPEPGCHPEAVCPFFSEEDEDRLGERLFADAPGHHPAVGHYHGLCAAAVSRDASRLASSSGGLATWLLASLVEAGEIDGVVHVVSVPGGAGPHFHYRLSRTPEEIRQGAGSRYYPVQWSEVLARVRQQPGRYAFVGVPCFIKGLRLLAAQDPGMAKRVALTVGLFCGHLKTAAFAEHLAWQMGVPPGHLAAIDFRHKRPARLASQYAVKAWDTQGRDVVANAGDLFGSDWGLGLFKPKACDYCDDIAAELADVACGDAWLSPYVEDGRGTNLLVVRRADLWSQLRQAAGRGEIWLEAVSAEQVQQSQAANYRHRRQGLAYRLWRAERRGRWHPPKRVA
ncbi:Coenzyme F420 hydrogenase/dehydrogenase, beta subunit C-terminal domain, partial [Ectothiorhodospira haloalkaliphila]